MKNKRMFLLSAVVILTIINSPVQAAIILYDVDFGSPPHTVNQPPVIGTGPATRHTPTRIWFGNPIVVSEYGDLVNQPLLLRDDGTSPYYSQVEFKISGSRGFQGFFNVFYIEMDIYIPYASGLTILLDTPETRSITFQPNGDVDVFVPGDYPKTIGGYPRGTYFRFKIGFASLCSIFIHGQELARLDLLADELVSIRVNDEHFGAAAIDNVLIYGYSNEPLVELEIFGPQEVADNTEAQYTATAHYNDGTSSDVTESANWSVSPETYGSINQDGKLTTGAVATAGYITINVQFSVANVTFSAQKLISYVPKQLNSLEITGPDEVPDSNSAAYTAIAYYDDDSTADVSQEAVWSVEPDLFANIDENGLLTTEQLYRSEETVLISSEYTYGPNSITAKKQVVIFANCTTEELIRRNISSTVEIKNGILEELETALAKEKAAEEILRDMQQSRDTGEWSFLQVVKARVKIVWSIIKEMWAKRKIEDSKENLEDSLEILDSDDSQLAPPPNNGRRRRVGWQRRGR
jgi:hypothetical protein